MGLMCEVLKVSCAGFYGWLSRPESKRRIENRSLEQKIREIHDDSRKIYGAPKIYKELKYQGVPCSLNRVARIMRQAGIKSKTMKKYKATTDSCHSLPVAPNLLNQHFDISIPNKVWVADITYIATAEGWLYLAALMDLYSRKIVGWSMDKRMTRLLTINALEMAIKSRQGIQCLTHHSDRGSQYASDDYQKVLKEHGIICSMSRKGNCYDNAVMENFFHLLKTEWVHHYRYQTRKQAKISIFEYIETFYNVKRRHSRLNYLSPCEYEDWKMAA